jgi:hypothetical protein
MTSPVFWWLVSMGAMMTHDPEALRLWHKLWGERSMPTATLTKNDCAWLANMLAEAERQDELDRVDPERGG